jgi:hypothetical protein
MGDDFCFVRWFGKIELESNEALPGAVFEVFEDVLITRIVGNHQQKSVGGFDNFAELIDGEQAPVIREWMNNHRGVLTRLDHFIEIAYSAGFHGPRERAIDPCGAVGVEKIAADQIAGGQIFMTGDGHEGNSPIGGGG